MIRIAQASSSETYTKFGTPPNQRRTGATKSKPGGNMDGELNVEAFHTGFAAVFRCTDPKIADKAATYAEHAVANGQYIGYGQNWIDDKYPMSGLFDAIWKATDPDPAKVTTLVNCTCATLVGACYYAAGIYEPKFRLLNTGEQEAIMMGTGMFVKLTDPDLVNSGRGIRRGDVLWRNGHTAMVLDDDPFSITIPYRTANCAYCNLRTGPSINYKVLETLKCGEPLLYLSTSENDWGQVSHNGLVGYVSGIYLEPLPTMTATFDVWLRADAGKDNESIIVIPKGAAVGITGRTKKVSGTVWHECIYASKIGFASGKYLV